MHRLKLPSPLVLLMALGCACGGAPAVPEPPVEPPSGEVAAPAAHPGYETRPSETRGGLGKWYMGREIARVMGHEGAEWLERPERVEEERPDLLLGMLSELGATPGAVVADVGAGSGYFTLPLAREVGPEGAVYAVDVQPEMLDILRGRVVEEGLANVVLVQAAEDDPRLPEEEVDLALLVDVYHELAFPYEVMRGVVEALAPGGRLVLVEYRGEDPELPILPLHVMTEEQVKKEMSVLPVRWVETREELPWQHVLVFEKTGAGR